MNEGPRWRSSPCMRSSAAIAPSGRCLTVITRRSSAMLRPPGQRAPALRRAVAAAKAAWRAKQALERRVYRPLVSEPGEWLSFDWGAAGTVPTAAGPRKLSFFSSVLGFSSYRTVSFSCSERFGALAVGLAHSFELVGGVPRPRALR